jgi:serine/threonine-protein kinase
VLAPGFLVTPTVRLVRPLGHGGMGSVWVADHLTLRTQVAVKFMSAETAHGPSSARFSREASAAASVKSPHVVTILDHGVTSPGNVPFIVMELLHGWDLRQLIQQRGALPLDLAANLLAQAGRGLAKAHEAGVVHRDVKPGEPLVKLLDFGVAKHDDDREAFPMTSTGAVVGTPYYMSPEQMLGAKNADARSDLWSLGVVAYHAVTGRVPFDGETIGALCVAIERGTFPPASQLRAGLPRTVDAWFEKAMARSPADRFASAREMTDAFEAALRGEGGGNRRAWIAVGVVVLIAVVVVGVGEAFLRPRRAGGGESSSVLAGEAVASTYVPPVVPPVSVSVVLSVTPAASSAPPAASSAKPKASAKPPLPVPPHP